MCQTPLTLQLPCGYSPEARPMPSSFAQRIQNSWKPLRKDMLIILRVLLLESRPGWDKPCICPTWALIVPPGMPSIYMPFRNTPCVQQRVVIVMGRLSESHTAIERKRRWASHSCLSDIIVLGLIPRMWRIVWFEEYPLMVCQVLLTIIFNVLMRNCAGSRPSMASSALISNPLDKLTFAFAGNTHGSLELRYQ